MSLLSQGVYVDDGNTAYEIECSYYLDFQITSALFSLEQLKNYNTTFAWKNKYQYYHYYCDHLLYSCGQISNRFLEKKQDSAKRKTQKRINQNNYLCTKDKYPILLDNRARNLIEHIDEYNETIIDDNKVVGGFNMIDLQTDPELVNRLLNERKTHNYIFDQTKETILLIKKKENIIIDLKKLKNELVQLRNNVKIFFDLMIF